MISRVLLPLVLALSGCPLAVIEISGGYDAGPEHADEISPVIWVASPPSGKVELFGLIVPLFPSAVTCAGHESELVLCMLRADDGDVDPWSLRVLATDGTWKAPSTVVEEKHHLWLMTFATTHRAGTPVALQFDGVGVLRLEPETNLRIGLTLMLFEEPLSWWWRWSWRS